MDIIMHTRRLFFIYDNWKILRMVWILTPIAMHGYDPSRKKTPYTSKWRENPF
jgi:hypothetical protein